MSFSKRKRSDSVSRKDTSSAPAAASAAAAAVPAKRSVMQAEETAFPRGGGSVLTPLEIKQAANEATRDVLFAASSAGKKEDGPKTKKHKAGKFSKSKKSAGGSGAKAGEESNKTRILSLALKQLVVGTHVLVQVSNITSFELVVSLPNSLSGYVPITNISKKFTAALEDVGSDSEDENDEDDIPKLSDAFKLGQWLRAIIVSTETDDNKKRLELTIDPDMVNGSIDDKDIVPGQAVQGSVSSVEDHGLVIDFGNSKVSGFISKKELAFVGFDIATAKPGQVLLLTILSKSPNGRTVTLTASPLNKKVPTLESVHSVRSATAGTLVEGTIAEVRGSGLVVKFYEHLTGTIDRFHAGHTDSSDSLTTIYNEGDSIKARVISTLPHVDENQVALSVLPHVIGLSADTVVGAQALNIGFTVEHAKVVSVDPNFGVFFSLGIDGVLGFCHKTKLSDEPILALTDAGAYATGTTHRARVLGYSYLDNMYTLSLEQSILDKKYLRVQDIPVGDVLEVTVGAILPKGDIIVNITDDLKGIVHPFQISDVKMANPEKKFKIGSKTKARVSYNNLRTSKQLLTKIGACCRPRAQQNQAHVKKDPSHDQGAPSHQLQRRRPRLQDRRDRCRAPAQRCARRVLWRRARLYPQVRAL